MSAPGDKYNLDFTSFFSVKTVQAERIDVPAKVVLDPHYRIGTVSLEADGYFFAAARRGAGHAPLGAHPRAYVVEDDPVTNAVLVKVLSIEGFKARGARDGEGMVKLLKEHGIPDLLVLDIELPAMSGLQILSRLRKHVRTHSTPVIIVTAHSNLTDVASGFALGANAYLSKPATVESLRAVMREIFGAPAG